MTKRNPGNSKQGKSSPKRPSRRKSNHLKKSTKAARERHGLTPLIPHPVLRVDLSEGKIHLGRKCMELQRPFEISAQLLLDDLRFFYGDKEKVSDNLDGLTLTIKINTPVRHVDLWSELSISLATITKTYLLKPELHTAYQKAYPDTKATLFGQPSQTRSTDSELSPLSAPPKIITPPPQGS